MTLMEMVARKASLSRWCSLWSAFCGYDCDHMKGSADVLEALGIKVDMAAAEVSGSSKPGHDLFRLCVGV